MKSFILGFVALAAISVFSAESSADCLAGANGITVCGSGACIAGANGIAVCNNGRYYGYCAAGANGIAVCGDGPCASGANGIAVCSNNPYGSCYAGSNGIATCYSGPVAQPNPVRQSSRARSRMYRCSMDLCVDPTNTYSDDLDSCQNDDSYLATPISETGADKNQIYEDLSSRAVHWKSTLRCQEI